jgi:hypothetical protein
VAPPTTCRGRRRVWSAAVDERSHVWCSRGSVRDVSKSLTRRPVLRPGLRVFRRDDTHLQVGIDEPRVVLPDDDGVRRLLRDLENGAGLASLTPAAGLAFGRLVQAGLVVERTELTMAARASRRVATGAVFAAHGPGATERLECRARCRVGVDAPDPWRATVADRLGVAGLVADEGRPTATLLVTLGEPRRSRVDALVRDDRTHLLVALLPDRVRLGPFVVPGTTACLRCLDAHLAEHDPRRGLVLEQLEDRDDPPAPCDPVLAQAGLALAVRELTTYAEGDRPATWSASLTLGADLALPRRAWSRHPHCGCSWG